MYISTNLRGMFFSVLSSGSSANSTFIEVAGKRYLIDCGLSAKQIEIRLGTLGIAPDSISGIFVTHEHQDHVKGLSVFSRRHKVPVFCNRATSKRLPKVYATEYFETGEDLDIGPIKLYPFQIMHDAVEPVGLVIEGEGLKFVHVTDLGRVTPIVSTSLWGANAVVLESNHDLDMLYGCEYPWELKQRISGNYGHLSNESACHLMREVADTSLSVLVLGHLSENSNSPELAFGGMKEILEYRALDTTLCCAGRNEPTSLFAVGESTVQVANF